MIGDRCCPVLRCMLALAICLWPGLSRAQRVEHAPEQVILDTDIGDDVDDAFAVGLAVRSPELQILGVMTTFGDTEARAKITDRFLAEVGRTEIPVLAGKATPPKMPMSQRRYGENRLAKPFHPDAVEFLLGQIRKYPGEITLI